jgi:putative Ca2+/H+ antiporter (TMEM165/GDT1 family)
MSSRWQSRVFVFLGATLGLSLVAGLVVAAGLMHG